MAGGDLAEPIGAETLQVQGMSQPPLDLFSREVFIERSVEAQFSALDHLHGRVSEERLGQGRRLENRVLGDGLIGLGALDSEALGPEELSVAIVSPGIVAFFIRSGIVRSSSATSFSWVTSVLSGAAAWASDNRRGTSNAKIKKMNKAFSDFLAIFGLLRQNGIVPVKQEPLLSTL
jgi:hypothetical protein